MNARVFPSAAVASLKSLCNSWLLWPLVPHGFNAPKFTPIQEQNGGSAGKHFLQRYFPLSVAVGWKFVALMFFLAWMLPVILAGQSREVLGWSTTAVFAALNMLMFWRIGFHLGTLHSEKASKLGHAGVDGLS